MTGTPINTSNIGIAVQELLLPAGDRKMRIAGSSMLPFLHPGDDVHIARNVNPLQIGACYVYILNKQLIIHRLAHVKKDMCYLIGDNTPFPHVVSQNAIIGLLNVRTNMLYTIFIKYANALAFAAGPHSRILLKLRIVLIRILQKNYTKGKASNGTK